MKNKSIILGVSIVVTALMLTLVGCQKAADQQAGNTTGSTSGSNPHSSGAINLSDFPQLEDKSIVEQAVKKMLAMKSFKVITHITSKKDSKLIADSDFEVTYTAPDKAYFFGDDNMTGKRQEIYQIGGTEHQSFDGVRWTKKTKAFPKYNFTPEAVNEMFRQGRNFHLISNDRPIEQSQSCTVVIFERPSKTHKGQKEQIDFWIDNETKNIVRIEILNIEKKPVTFSEEFLRFSEHDSQSLKIEPPAEARDAK